MAAIVQARYGSSRLPGKVLERIQGLSVLAHVLGRLQRVPGIDVVVGAVPRSTPSDGVAREVENCGAVLFRGSEDDVLDRYRGAARMVNADIIVRVTSDCPLIDPDVCGAVLIARRDAHADFAANNMPPSFPHGLDCEVLTYESLERAAQMATDPVDREHVTSWIRRANNFTRTNVTADDVSYVNERWTLDYPEDLTFLREVFARLPGPLATGWHDVVRTILRNPELTVLNASRRVPRA